MLDFSKFYHVGIVVPDLTRAIEEHQARGVKFNTPIVASRTAHGPTGPIHMNVRACYGRAPACIEIVEEMPGTLWTAGEAGRLHHLAFLAEDLDLQSRQLAGAGWPRVAWSEVGWVYHQSPFGYYVELIGPSLRAAHAKVHDHESETSHEQAS